MLDHRSFANQSLLTPAATASWILLPTAYQEFGRRRSTAMGKKNWLFVGEAQAGERGAILYTIIETCRRRGIDPYAYIKDMLTRLPSMTNHQVHEVTPQAWAKARLQVQGQAV